NLLPGERNPVEAAYRYLDDHPALFRSGAPRCQFSSGGLEETAALPGSISVRMNQRYAAVPVYGAQLALQLDRNLVMSAGGHTLPRIDLDTHSKLTADDAVRAARDSIAANASRDPSAAGWVADVLAAPATARLEVFPGEL